VTPTHFVPLPVVLEPQGTAQSRRTERLMQSISSFTSFWLILLPGFLEVWYQSNRHK
jgi:hypothetical protein